MKEFIFTNIGYAFRMLVLFFCVYGIMNRICTMIERINGIGVYYIEKGGEDDDNDDERQDI